MPDSLTIHDPASDAIALVRSVRIALEGFEEIALLQDSCPLAAEKALAALRGIKHEIAPEIDAELRELIELDRELHVEGAMARVGADSLDAALGEGRR